MQFIKHPIHLLLLLLFGSTLLADCEYYPANDFRNFGRPPRGDPWEELFPKNECSPCSECPPCSQHWLANQLEVGAEALYWKPSFGGVQYAVNTSNSPTNMPLIVKSSWNWGYRVNARIKSCSENLYLHGTYLNFRQSNNQTVIGTIIPLFSDTATATAATAKIRNIYDAADLVAGYRWLNCPCIESSIFAGGRFFHILETENFNFTVSGAPSIVRQKYCMRGGGPRIGLDFTYRPFACGWLGGFGVHGMVAELAGIGSQKQLYDNPLPQILVTEGFQRFPSTRELILNTDMRLEAFYSVGFCSVKLQVNGGYELNFYTNGRSRIASAAAISLETNQGESIGFGGPFIGFNLFW